MTVGWPAVILLQAMLLLIGVALRVGFDMPWKVALFPFYAPPIVVGVSVLGCRWAGTL